jgi:GNAT superfamily N-acetyltransferase
MAGARIGVRAASASDAEAIGEAHAESWLAAYVELFDHEFLVAAAESRRTGWRDLIGRLLMPPHRLLVGELDGRVVAVAHSVPSDNPAAVEVCGFYAHPAAWGSGIAPALMRKSISDAGTAFDEAILWTFRDASRARHFYEKVGYVATGRERSEEVTDWSSGVSACRPAVQYLRQLRTDR